MQLFINLKNITLNAKQKALIQKRYAFCFSKFSEVVKKVVIYIEDINGPKGGVDKQCKVQVSLRRGDDVIVTEKQSILNKAIEKALQRSSYITMKKLKRKKAIPNRTLVSNLLVHENLPLNTSP